MLPGIMGLEIPNQSRQPRSLNSLCAIKRPIRPEEKG